MERRIFERVRARFPTRFQHSINGFGTDVFLRDISAQGIKFTTKRRFLIHDSVSLIVSLPDGQKPLIFHGRVVWIRQKAGNLWDVGLQLEEPDFQSSHRILQIVAAP